MYSESLMLWEQPYVFTYILALPGTTSGLEGVFSSTTAGYGISSCFFLMTLARFTLCFVGLCCSSVTSNLKRSSMSSI